MILKIYLNAAIVVITILVMFFVRKRPKKEKKIIHIGTFNTGDDFIYQAMKIKMDEKMKKSLLVGVILFISVWGIAVREILTLNNILFFFISIFGLGFYTIMRFFYSKTISLIIYILLFIKLITLFLIAIYYIKTELIPGLLFFIVTVLLIASVDKKLLKKEKLFAPQN